jgi:hypothetical protein
MPRCGRRAGPPGTFIRRRTGRAAASMYRATAAARGSRYPGRDFPGRPAASDLPWRLPRRSASTRSSMHRTADCTAPTMPGAAGSWSPTTSGSGSAAGISAASPSSRRMPTWSMPATRRSIARPTAAIASYPSRARRGAMITIRCGSIRRPRRDASSASTRARSCRSTAARPGARGSTSQPASSITSPPIRDFRTGCTARSRTRERQPCRAARTGSMRSTSPSSTS